MTHRGSGPHCGSAPLPAGNLSPPRPATFTAALILICVLLTAPLMLIEVPPLLDYPNHLARVFALANPTDPFLSRFYAPNWTIIPDLGIDLVLPPLLQILPIHVAGRLVIAAVILLPVLGTVALSHAVHGQRCWWSFGSGLVAWNQASLLGFLNFTAGIGLGLLLAASWVQWRDQNPGRAFTLAMLGTPVIFFCHLMGLVCFALIVGTYELRAAWAAPRAWPARLFLAALPFLLPLLLYSLSTLGGMPGEAQFAGVADKLRKLIAPTENYVLPLDVATAFLIAVTVCAGLLSATRNRRRTGPSPASIPQNRSAPDAPSVRFRSQAAVSALILAAVLFILAPAEFKGVHHFDTRFIIFFGFLLFACLKPRLPRVAYFLLAAWFCLRMTVLSAAWAGQASDLADLRKVIAVVPPGSRVFLTIAQPGARTIRIGRQLSLGEPVLDHLAAILPIERRAWWPFLFDNPSQQPISTREPYRTLALRTATIHDLASLPAADLCGFDYMLLLTPGDPQAGDHPPASHLTPVAHAGMASLFAVAPGACAGRS